MSVVIRRAKENELKIVQDLNHALFESDYSSDPELNMDWPYQDGKEYFIGAISGKTGVCFVAEDDDKIVGYLVGSIKTDNPSYRLIKRSELENMFVLEGYRGRGIGSQLAEAFISWSKDNKISHTFVSAYSPNIRAIKFYEKLGFTSYVTELEIKNN